MDSSPSKDQGRGPYSTNTPRTPTPEIMVPELYWNHIHHHLTTIFVPYHLYYMGDLKIDTWTIFTIGLWNLLSIINSIGHRSFLYRMNIWTIPLHCSIREAYQVRGQWCSELRPEGEWVGGGSEGTRETTAGDNYRWSECMPVCKFARYHIWKLKTQWEFGYF